MWCAYPSKFVSLNLFRLASSKASLVYQLGKFLLDKLIDLGNGRLQAALRRAGDVQVQRGILAESALASGPCPHITYGGGCHAFVGVVVSTGGDILKQSI